jgi:hypothetical protein
MDRKLLDPRRRILMRAPGVSTPWDCIGPDPYQGTTSVVPISTPWDCIAPDPYQGTTSVVPTNGWNARALAPVLPRLKPRLQAKACPTDKY